MSITQAERKYLRELAKRVSDIAHLPVMGERIRAWKRHNALRPGRPLVLFYASGAWGECLGPWRCTSDDGIAIENELRRRIYSYEHFHDDRPVVDKFNAYKWVETTGWGIEADYKRPAEGDGAYTYDPVITEPSDLKKLRIPRVIHKTEKTQRELELMQEVLGDILKVQLRGFTQCNIGFMDKYAALRGLTQIMTDMALNPQMLHDAMAFYEEAHMSMIRQYTEQNLLSMNNDETENGPGGPCWTDILPKPDFDPDHVRPCDMWVAAEAQQLAQVSPEMHEEFCLQYERRIMAQFGLAGYGCCEDLTKKLDYVLQATNIRRVSISPWANVDACAERLRNRAIFSWKPHPTYLALDFDLNRIREYVSHTLDVTERNGCVVELYFKNAQTVENHPERFTIVSDMVREMIDARYG